MTFRRKGFDVLKGVDLSMQPNVQASVFLATALLLALAASDYYLDERAFVSTAKAVVCNGALEGSPESFKATDGTELLVHDRKGEFLEVETRLGQKGWIHSGDVELLMP